MTDTELPPHFIPHTSPLHHLPHHNAISEISNIEPDLTQEPFEIQEDELEAIEVLINGMTELHDEDSSECAFIQELSQQNRCITQLSNTPQMKEQMLKENTLNNSPVLNKTIDQNSQFRILVAQKCKEIEGQLGALQISKFQIIDELITFKKWIVGYTTSQREKWEAMIERQIEQKAKMREQYEYTVPMLSQGLDNYKNKYEQMLHQKQQYKQNNEHLYLQIKQLQHFNRRLNKQLQLLETENNDLKYQLCQHSQTESIIKQLQEEIRLLNRTIDQNSEYIFDLEQRVATQSLLLHEKEINIRNQMETQLQQQRKEIEKQYKAEFEKMRDEIEEQIRKELRNDDLIVQSIKQQYKKELASLQAPYLSQNQKLLEQNKKLHQNVQEYQLRLKQIDGKLNTSSSTQRQLAKKIDNFHLRLNEKDVELNYYKQRLEQLELSKTHPPKTNNIMLIDDNNKSSSIIKQSAVSPSSTGTTYLPSKQVGSPRDEMINNILSRIRMKQNYSILSNANQNNISIESVDYKKGLFTSSAKPVSPQSMILQKQKDLRMKNISFKLQQLRSDIRREIGLISN